MENQEEVKKVSLLQWYYVSIGIAFFCFLFTTEAEGIEMLGAVGSSAVKAVMWPFVLLYKIF